VRDLHVVAVSEDGRHVLLGPTKSKASHKVRLDARLVSAVRGELGKPTGELSPKEIQARLRAGESAEQIATSAGMALTRVERFQGPVAGEMARMIDEARDGYVVRGRLGRSAVALGKAVDTFLAEHAKPESVTWTTRREEDGRWRVQVAWFSRGKTRDAAWWYEPHAKSLDAVDPQSAALGHVDGNPAPPRRLAKKAAPAPAPAPEKKPAAARKATPAKQAAAKKPAPAAPKPATRSATKPAPKAAAKPARKAPAGRPRLQVVPDPPAAKRAAKAAPMATPAAKPTVAEERDGVKARASVPAWADVLLGTTPSNDH
jgi:hypothetical protein